MKPSTARFLSRPSASKGNGSYVEMTSKSGKIHRIELGSEGSKTVVLVSLLPQN
jgi:hypothetical protein